MITVTLAKFLKRIVFSFITGQSYYKKQYKRLSMLGFDIDILT